MKKVDVIIGLLVATILFLLFHRAVSFADVSGPPPKCPADLPVPKGKTCQCAIVTAKCPSMYPKVGTVGPAYKYCCQ